MPHIHVTCAIIERNGHVLAAQRSSSMKMPLKWEFPGGKIEEDEAPRDCLQREIFEELSLNVEIICDLSPVSYQYPDFRITLYPYVCSTTSNAFKLREHSQALWLKPEALHALDWAEADLPVLAAYNSWLENGRQ
ncbi:MAG: (deoxy)nucleoside triphosphate pyrophosphohydrolase [Desulfovermiculus sp.]|nr:(deoxy)nucleoside triphosphate pyrophosphohydrolase [Desulfovermiculus sp.]